MKKTAVRLNSTTAIATELGFTTCTLQASTFTSGKRSPAKGQQQSRGGSGAAQSTAGEHREHSSRWLTLIPSHTWACQQQALLRGGSDLLGPRQELCPFHCCANKMLANKILAKKDVLKKFRATEIKTAVNCTLLFLCSKKPAAKQRAEVWWRRLSQIDLLQSQVPGHHLAPAHLPGLGMQQKDVSSLQLCKLPPSPVWAQIPLPRAQMAPRPQVCPLGSSTAPLPAQAVAAWPQSHQKPVF